MLELSLFVAYGIITGLATIASVLIINKSKNLINMTASFTTISYAIYASLRAVEEFFNTYFATLTSNTQNIYTFVSFIFYTIAPIGFLLSVLIVIHGEVYVQKIYFWIISLIYILINITIWFSSYVFSNITVDQGNALFNFFPIIPFLIICFELISISRMAVDLKTYIYLLIIGIFVMVIGLFELSIADFIAGLDILRILGFIFLIIGAFIGMFAFLIAKSPRVTAI